MIHCSHFFNDGVNNFFYTGEWFAISNTHPLSREEWQL
jgi:hypothetical protein